MDIKVDRITKNFKNKIAVDRVSFELHEGITGLLGANGAGKTTLMRMMAGILVPSSGEVNAAGIDVSSEEYRALLGYLPQSFGYYPEFTAKDFLMYFAALKGLKKKESCEKSEYLLQLVGLEDYSKKRIKTLSGGMIQRLAIAQSLINSPKLLILDEPTAGLDPQERVRFRRLLEDISDKTVILFSTHIISDIENIAENVLIMKSGKLVYKNKWNNDGSLEDLYLDEVGR